ncbi:hypothetical protein PC129_g4842 [Phytophthora cactorum]|uniref:Uncharacterized protein n=1 Tax=Phytophthora cactorum TaxID=29920 RepID=A0A329SE06_9STRA|nr:hypothetical protein Pcac1_g24248 [Phytophthora cactorum]KAG2795895.1 hypothetical protein PC111_g21955 [Phytophthora cactorum]KAG2823339.1 hypothetical protein PC113_g22199 [Phytophthora cactorum]KAG2831129.1 hypothetical protein PC112_g7397 [Phytophthora cactorum]KAG2875221.1 hypothetical protein PC114_g24848 [Phytophthora cactorum]
MYADVQEEITKLQDSPKDVDADLDQTAALLAEAADKLRARRAGQAPGKRARSRSASPAAGQPVPKTSTRGVSAPPGDRSSPLVPARSSPLCSKGTGRAGLQFLGSQHQGSPDRDERNPSEIIEIQDEGGDHGELQGTDQSEVEEIQDDGGDQYEYDEEEGSDEQGADKLPASDVESQALSANAFDHDQAPSSDSDGETRAALARSQ